MAATRPPAKTSFGKLLAALLGIPAPPFGTNVPQSATIQRSTGPVNAGQRPELASGLEARVGRDARHMPTTGKVRRFRIKIFPGDRVKVELSPYGLSRGRIVYRFK